MACWPVGLRQHIPLPNLHSPAMFDGMETKAKPAERNDLSHSRSGQCAPFARVRLVVYDLDGTLVDSFRDIWKCVNRVFTDFGLQPLTFDRVKGAVGDGARTLIQRLLNSTQQGSIDEVHRRFIEYYRENPTAEARLYPGVKAVQAKVRRAGITQAILTNKPHPLTLLTCSHLALTDSVDGIWGAQEDRPLKPDPESLLAILRYYDVPVANVVMVGDYGADHQVARSAGVAMIGVTWGLLSREESLACKPDALIDRMDQLPKLLGLNAD